MLIEVIKARQDQVAKAAKATATAKKWYLPETKVPNDKVEATKRAVSIIPSLMKHCYFCDLFNVDGG
jgi:hypothetical protein